MDYLKNGWNWVHLMGGVIGVQNSSILVGDRTIMWILLTLVADILKEVGDYISSQYQVVWMWNIGFDPAGFDVRDVMMCGIGIAIGLGLEVLKWRL